MEHISRRNFLKITGMAVAATGLTHAAKNPLVQKLMALDSKLKLAVYEQIVKNTSNFRFSGNYRGDVSIFSDQVRKFLEQGGLYRTEKRPASSKDFSTVLHIDKQMWFATGTKNVVTPSGQQTTKNVYTVVKPGIHVYNYDTEARLTLKRLGEDKEALRITLNPIDRTGILSNAPVSLSATGNIENMKNLMQAINSTVEIYRGNKEMAQVMEMALDALYSKGNAGSGIAKEGYYQSDSGKLAAKTLVRELMKDMEEMEVRNSSERIAKMTVPFVLFFPLHILGSRTNNIDQARRELVAANNTVDNLLVSFQVENKKLVMVVENGTEFEKGAASYNPTIQYRMAGTNGNYVQFKNSYESQIIGLTDGLDYDNSKASKEPQTEYDRKILYRMGTGTNGIYGIGKPNMPKLFVVNIEAPAEQIAKLFLAGYEQASK
ncbi:TPA: twin-arginine translocation signal domain-containing protein [Candidatus Micrarchaeota archaeon]|nr:twin-arginine translocation signal domain-containing protein [Candidatus Micrarchaeota archaeon]